MLWFPCFFRETPFSKQFEDQIQVFTDRSDRTSISEAKFGVQPDFMVNFDNFKRNLNLQSKIQRSSNTLQQIILLTSSSKVLWPLMAVLVTGKSFYSTSTDRRRYKRTPDILVYSMQPAVHFYSNTLRRVPPFQKRAGGRRVATRRLALRLKPLSFKVPVLR